jgi:hypothetical protein
MKQVLNSEPNKTILYKNTLRAAKAENLIFSIKEFEEELRQQLRNSSNMEEHAILTSPEPLGIVNLHTLEQTLHGLRLLSRERIPNPAHEQADEQTVRIVRRREVSVREPTIRPIEDDVNVFSVSQKKQTPRSLLGYS